MGLFSTNLSIRASKMSSVCLLLHYIILQHTTSHKIMLPPCVKLFLTSEYDAIQRTRNTFSHSAAPNQTKLHLVAPHTIPASPEQHTLYVTLSSSLSSTIICPPQNPLAVIVLMFELLLCDINIRILLKTFQVLRLVQLGQWMFPTHHCKL